MQKYHSNFLLNPSTYGLLSSQSDFKAVLHLLLSAHLSWTEKAPKCISVVCNIAPTMATITETSYHSNCRANLCRLHHIFYIHTSTHQTFVYVKLYSFTRFTYSYISVMRSAFSRVPVPQSQAQSYTQKVVETVNLIPSPLVFYVPIIKNSRSMNTLK